MTIQRHKNCGNSPKNAFIEEFVVRFVTGELLGKELSPDMSIEYLGLETKESLTSPRALSLTVSDAISHGKKGAVDFSLEMQKPNGETHFLHFGMFVTFKTIKGDSISSVRIFGP